MDFTIKCVTAASCQGYRDREQADVTEVCSEDGSSCTISERACTESECTLTSIICIVVGDQKACGEPMATVEPIETAEPVPEETVTAPAAE